MRGWMLLRRRTGWTRRRAALYLWLATVTWALTLPAYKLLLTAWTPLQVQFWRHVVAVFLVVGLGRLRGIRQTGRAYVRAGVLSLLLWLGFTAQTYGISRTTASKAAFLTSLAALFGPLLALGLFGKRALRVAGLRVRTLGLYWLLALVGTALITIHDDWTWRWNVGDLLCVGASLAFAVESVLIDRWVTPTEARWYAGMQMVGMAVLSALWGVLTGASLAAPVEPVWGWGLVIGLAVFPSWLAFEWQMAAQPRLQTLLASFIYALEPLQGALLSVLLLDERLGPTQWAGGLLLVAALAGISDRVVGREPHRRTGSERPTADLREAPSVLRLSDVWGIGRTPDMGRVLVGTLTGWDFGKRRVGNPGPAGSWGPMGPVAVPEVEGG